MPKKKVLIGWMYGGVNCRLSESKCWEQGYCGVRTSVFSKSKPLQDKFKDYKKVRITIEEFSNAKRT